MKELSKEEVLKVVQSLANEQPWHHNFLLPFGIWTRPDPTKTYAKNLKKWERLSPFIKKIDLKGKRALDVGCSDGYYSFEISKLGVEEIVGIDLNEKRLKKANFIKDVLSIENTRFEKKSIQEIDQKEGKFSIAICLGFLHRYPDPYGLLKKLTELSDIIVLEWKIPRVYHSNLPSMTLATNNIHGCDQYNISFWYPTIACVMDILKRNGFQYHYPIDDGINKRVALVSAKKTIQGLEDKNRLHSKSCFALIYKYSKLYIRTLYHILNGRIRA